MSPDKPADLDLSDIELRIFAQLVGAAPTEDPYRAHAAKLFNVAAAEVTKEQREFAKLDLYRKIYSSAPRLRAGPATGRR